jgi:hypothetical protein
MLEAWGINLAIGVFQEVFISEPIKVFIIHIMLLGVMRPQVWVHRHSTAHALPSLCGPLTLSITRYLNV